MEKILLDLGVKGINDYTSVISIDAFEKVKVEEICNVLKSFGMNDTNLIDTEESKFEHINLILMFRYEKLIDSIKILDGTSINGFRLEPMP
jgi:hypothetical protein